jgi:nucleoid-associated protein YgaU
MGWGQRLGLATALVLVGSVAGAASSGVNGFVPVAIEGAPGEGTVVVEPGDHLWKISEAELARRLGRSAGPDEVAPYWLTVIDANRDSLHSGDPDLIYPGELITLPAPSPGGG